MISRRTAFEVCLGTAIVAAMWAVGWYHATSAIFSDLASYGIKYRGVAYNEIIATTQRHILIVCVPLAVVLGVSLITWGIQIWRDVRVLQASVASSRESRD